MGKKNKVYEELLTSYLNVRNVEIAKREKAKQSIAEAEKTLEENKLKMDKAIENEDQAGYEKLYASNNKNEATILFFRGILENLKKNKPESDIDAAQLCAMADEEAEKIKAQYVEDILKLMQPIIECSENARLQLSLIKLAKGKIRKNISEVDISVHDIRYGDYDLPIIRNVDQLLQSPDYRNADHNNSAYYDWDSQARAKYNEEVSKWI